jgi:RNA polymerase sigma factor (sigma-70 family)
VPAGSGACAYQIGAEKADIMGDRRAESALRDVDALFRFGVISGMTDGQLLERFAAQSDSDSQIAFEAIVRRHGPMVLGVCLRALGDYHTAEDAFQATFMVLAVKSRAIQKRESLGPWLHGVAVRIAHRRHVLGRRSKAEPIPAGGVVDPVTHDPGKADVSAVIDEELGRLPDRYRLPIVLCCLEGQTQDEAARTLGWTKGTVSGRLARAKDLLRHRLTRRGLAPTAAGLITASLSSHTARAAVPPALLMPTVRAALATILGGAELGMVAGPVAALAREALKVMLLGRIGRAAALVIFLGLGAAALATPMLLPGVPAHRDLVMGRFAGVNRVARGPGLDASTALIDRFGDPLPTGAHMRLGTIQRRHTRRVAGIDFTRDGRAAVTAQVDGLVRFWDPDNGRQLRTIDVMADAPTNDKSLRALAMSADGELLAAAGFALDPARRRIVHRVWVWDLKREKLQRVLEVPGVDLFSIAFAPDGVTLATGGFAGEARLWNLATGDCHKSLKLGNSSLHSVSFAPEGNVLAVCEQGKGTKLYDIAQGRETLIADPQIAAIAPIFSADGRLMALNALGGEAVLWDRTTDRRHLTVQGVAMSFAPDSRSLAMYAPDGGAMLLIDTETGSETWKIEVGWGPTARGSLAFSPNGRTIIAERGGTLRFFDATTGHERLGSPEAHRGGVSVVQYLPDGRAILTAGEDGTVRQWDCATGHQIRIFPQEGRVSSLVVSGDGMSLATAVQGPRASVSVWDLETGLRRQRWPGDDDGDGAPTLAFSADCGTLLAFDPAHGLRFLEIATGEEREAEQPRLSLDQGDTLSDSIASGVFSPGNQFLAVMTSTVAHVADVATGQERLRARGQTVAFRADGRAFAIATPCKPDVTLLADGSHRTMGPVADGVELVDPGTLKRKRVAIAQETVTALALSPDGKVIAVAGGWTLPTVRLYRTADGRETATFTCPARVAHAGALAFAPDGLSLAAGIDDTTVVIWDLRGVR